VKIKLVAKGQVVARWDGAEHYLVGDAMVPDDVGRKLVSSGLAVERPREQGRQQRRRKSIEK